MTKGQEIERALSAKGYTATSIEWSPVGGMAEKQGREGGWFVFFEPGTDPLDPHADGFVGGFSADEVLAQIADLPMAMGSSAVCPAGRSEA